MLQDIQKKKKNKLLEIIGKKDSFKSDYKYYIKNGSIYEVPKEIKDFYDI